MKYRLPIQVLVIILTLLKQDIVQHYFDNLKKNDKSSKNDYK